MFSNYSLKLLRIKFDLDVWYNINVEFSCKDKFRICYCHLFPILNIYSSSIIFRFILNDCSHLLNSFIRPCDSGQDHSI